MVLKVVGSNLDWTSHGLTNPAVNGYLLESGKDKAAKGEGWALPFI